MFNQLPALAKGNVKGLLGPAGAGWVEGWGRVQSILEAIAQRHLAGSELMWIGGTLGFRDTRSPRQDYPMECLNRLQGETRRAKKRDVRKLRLGQ